MSHQRLDDAGPRHDALPAPPDSTLPGPDGVGADARGETDAACVPGVQPVLRFEPGPPMPGGPVTFLGIESAPSEDGVRIHLDSCGGSCPFDLVVSDVGDGLARIGGADAMASATLDTDGSTYAVLHVLDARRCAGCGGTIDLIVGDLVSGRSDALEVRAGTTRCSTGCGELREITVAADTAEVVLGQHDGGYTADRTLFGHVARGYHAPCVVCDCAQPDMPASGAAAALTGIFVPAP